MPRELLMMQNSFQWETAEGQTLETENAIRSNVRDLKIEGQTYQNLLSETKSLGKFVYDESTGEYTLTNPSSGEWNAMAINYTRPIQAGEKLLIRINFVKNTIVSTNNPPIKITYSDGSSGTKGFINVDAGFTGLIEYYCNGAIATYPFNTKIDISTRAYSSGELVIKDIQVIPVSSNPLGSTELPTPINGIESVAEREIKNLLENVKWHDGWINVGTGALESTPSANPNAIYTDLIPIDINNRYYFNLASNNNNNVYRIRPYDANKNYVVPNDNAGNPNLGNSFNIFHANRSLLATVKYIRILLLDSSAYPLPSKPILVQNLYTEGDVNVKGTGSWYNVRKYVTVKPNTEYKISVDIESISKGSNNYPPAVEFYSNEKYESNFLYRIYNSSNFTLTTKADTTILVIVFVVNNAIVSTTECEANFKNICISESSYSHSVRLTNRSKNLLDLSTFKPISYNTIQTSKDGNVITVKGLRTSDVESVTDAKAGNIKVYLEENKTYSASFKSDGDFGVTVGTDTVEIFFMLDGTTKHYFNVAGQRTVTIPKGRSGYYYLRFDVNSGDKTHKFWDIQVEEGSVITDYEPYREPTLTEIPLPQPLRSLPNGVCDVIKRDKLYQNIYAFVIDENTQIFSGTWDNQINTIGFSIVLPQNRGIDGIMSSYLTTYNNNSFSVDREEIHCTYNRCRLRILRSKLETQNTAGFKKFLQSNPITILYALETPIEHTINIPPISISKGSNIITTTNNIKPNLSIKYKKLRNKR